MQNNSLFGRISLPNLQNHIRISTRVRSRFIIAVALVITLPLVVLTSHIALLYASSTAVGAHSQKTMHNAVSLPLVTPSYGGWNMVAIAVPAAPSGQSWHISNSNYLNGHSALMSPLGLPQPQFGGISQNGQDLLYQITSSGHTYYFRLLARLAATSFFYELNAANAGNAIWLPDNRHVLIATVNTGVLEVDTLTGKAGVLLPALKNVKLTFYHNDYLYFVGGQHHLLVALSRINIATGVIQSVTPFNSFTTSYWLSPTGSTIYFANKIGPGGELGIYAVNVDGTNFHLLRQYQDGTPVGYAADNSLFIMRLQRGIFQVVKLGATPGQDEVVMANAAPGAVSLCDTAQGGPDLICDNDIAMAPYGHALIIQVTFADGTHKIWNDDLTTGRQFILQVGLGSGILVRPIGWDRISIN